MIEGHARVEAPVEASAPEPPSATAARRPPSRTAERKRMALRTLAVSFAVVGVVVTVLEAFDATGPARARNDFTQDYVSARAWLHGEDPYATTESLVRRHVGPDARFFLQPPDHRNPHPPALIVLTAPLAPLPFAVAKALWILGMSALTGVSVGAIGRAKGLSRGQAIALGLAATGVPVAVRNAQLAQSTGLLLGLLVPAWLALRRGHDLRAGALLGLAGALRLSPLFLLVPLLRMRRMKAAATTLAVAAATSGIATLAMGAGATRRFASETSSDNLDFFAAAPFNLSLVGYPFRLLTRNPWRGEGVDWQAAALVAAALVVLGCAVAAWLTPARASGDAFWAAVPWMILAGPLSWDFSLPLMIPVVVLVALRRPLRDRLALGLGLVVLLGFPPYAPSVPVGQPVTASEMMAYGVPTVMLLLLAAAEWRRPQRPGPRREPVAAAPGYSV